MAARSESLIYAVDDVPPLLTTVFLGLQQVALMAIYLVMVVIVVRTETFPDLHGSSRVGP